MAQHTVGQNNGGTGPEIYATQPEEAYTDLSPPQNRHDSAVSEIGQADQLVTPSINIEPAPVSRQASFEVDNRKSTDALQPPSSKWCQRHHMCCANDSRNSWTK
jgi:hypothetical protein